MFGFFLLHSFNLPFRHTVAKKNVRKSAVCRFGFLKYPMVMTEALQPLSCDPSESQKHANYLKTIKSVLTDSDARYESLTMTQFLQLINLSYEQYVLATRSTVRSDYFFFLANELPTGYMLTTIMFLCLKASKANTDILFVFDVSACEAYIASCVAKSGLDTGELLQTACREAKLGK
jgi:hypothetical protein